MPLLGSKCSRTTSYHAQSNGMVECFHHQLKASLKAQTNPEAWMDSLPLILLGIQTKVKQDILSTSVEMVYGTTLRLPGEFFTSFPTLLLKSHFNTVRPTPSRLTERTSSIPDELATAIHLFISHDGVRKPLQQPYDGTFPIIPRTDKHYTISINGRNDTVSIDILKPAHLDTDSLNSNSTSNLSSLRPAITQTPLHLAFPSSPPISIQPPHEQLVLDVVSIFKYLSRHMSWGV